MKILLIFICLFFYVAAIAQNTANNALGFPSTNNNFLGKKTPAPSVGVDPYTGTALVSIPICNLASKGLTLPVSLDYVDGRGVRVEEYASQVGLGWELNAGGSISRVVRGFPDEQPNGYLGTTGDGTNRWGQVVTTGAIASGSNAVTFASDVSQADMIKLTGISLSNNEPTADGEPDLFNVKTPYFNFQFVFDQAGNPVVSNYNGYKIIPNSFINSGNYLSSWFEVIDDKGNQFYFGNKPNSTEQMTDSLYSVPTSFISSWYLTKIIAYNAQDSIMLSYQASTTADVTYNYSWMETQNYQFVTQTILGTGKSTNSKPLFVSTISSALGELDFTYSFNTRQDDINMPSLTSILVKAYNPQTVSNSIALQTYNFNYSYFGTPSSDPNVLRLELNGITVTGNTSGTSAPLNIATFGYTTVVNGTSVSLPSRALPVFDYWGFCTTMPSPIPPDIFSINRSPNVNNAQADILNSITTTIGGIWQLSYELNTYNPSTGSINVGGLRVYKIAQQLPTGESLYKTYSYLDLSGNSSGEIYNSNYNILSVITTTGQTYTVYFSNSPYITTDFNGVFVGYSYVKETNQNGGYTMYKYTNFKDAGFGDFNSVSVSDPGTNFILIPSTSFAYRRGLLLNKSVYNYNNIGGVITYNIVSQTANTYAAQSTSVTYGGYGLREINFPTAISGAVWHYFGLYSTPVENYRLTQSVQTDYDQKNTASYVQTTTNYTYHLNSLPNICLVNGISTTDSKGLAISKNIYFPDQTTAIPMSGSEQTAITAMKNGNLINVPIHEIDSRNGVTTQVHNSYSSSGIFNNNSGFANTYPASTSSYNTVGSTSTLAKQEIYNYDTYNSNLITSNALAGKSTAVLYGYNSSYPISEAVNATNTVSYTYQPQVQTGILNVPPNTWGAQIANFTTNFVGPITIAMPPGSYLAGSVSCFFSFSLSGPSGGSGSLCNSSATGYTCSVGNTVTFTNMASGNYTLSVSAFTNTATSPVPVDYTYTGEQLSGAPYTEFFFEGFEQNSSATKGAAHTGNMYWNANYTVSYTPPNGRSYLIQYWNLSGGIWNFNEVPYTTGMVLTGPVDDIRVFPTDALMTSYTYNPLVGKTSETDPSGQSIIYQYDGLNRVQTVLDQNSNILKEYDYEYQLLAAPAYNIPEYGSFQMSCSPGYIGTYVTYPVPAGKYSSYISQLAANQLAINDVNANGQAYANNPANGGTCAVAETVTYTDSRAFQYSVRFTNNSTGLIYNFLSNANSSGTLGQVPSGTYTIYICPLNNYTPNNNYTVFGSSQSNVVCATFNNVSVTASGSISFH